jgi:hypothetical protein
MGRKRASTRWRVRAALSIDFSSRDEAAGRPAELMLEEGAQPGGYLRKGSVAGASEELPAGACLPPGSYRRPAAAFAGMASIRVVSGTVNAKSAPNAAAGLSAPRGDRVRVSSTARMLAAAVKA